LDGVPVPSATTEVARFASDWFDEESAAAVEISDAFMTGKTPQSRLQRSPIGDEITTVAQVFDASPENIEQLLRSRGPLDSLGGMLLLVESGYLESEQYRRQMRVLREIRKVLDRADWPFEDHMPPPRQWQPQFEEAIRAVVAKSNGAIWLKPEPHPLSRASFDRIVTHTDVPAQIQKERQAMGIIKGLTSNQPLGGLWRAAKEIANELSEYLTKCLAKKKRTRPSLLSAKHRGAALKHAVQLVTLAYPLSAKGLTAEAVRGTVSR